MAFTQAQLDALTERIAQTTKKIQHGDKTVELSDLQDMLDLRDRMTAELNTTRSRVNTFRFRRGS